MPTLSMPEPRGWLLLGVNRLSPKASVLLVPDASVLLWEGRPIAVESGSVVYTPDTAIAPAAVRALNDWKQMLPHCRLPVDQWDFTLGSALTKAGLQLTRQPQETYANA